jgi:hypothetical protein
MWPKLLWLESEHILPDRRAEHIRQNARYAGLLAEAGASHYRLGLTPVTGKSTQALFVSGFDTYGSLDNARSERRAVEERDSQANGGPGIGSDVFAVLREDGVSGQGSDFSKARFFYAVSVKTRNGHSTDYSKLLNLIVSANEKTGRRERFGTYQVVAGGSPSLHIVLQPLTNLAELEPDGLGHKPGGPGDNEELHRRAHGAEGADEMRQLARAAVESTQAHIWKIDPSISFVTGAFSNSADDDFWSAAARA